jgi:hypothetical protein
MTSLPWLEANALRCAPLSPSPRARGEGRGEGRPLALTLEIAAAPHPSPLPVTLRFSGRGDWAAFRDALCFDAHVEEQVR